MAQNTEQKEMTQVTTKHTKDKPTITADRSSALNLMLKPAVRSVRFEVLGSYWFGFAEGGFVKAFRAALEHVSNV